MTKKDWEILGEALEILDKRLSALEVKFGIRPTKREQNARQTPDAH